MRRINPYAIKIGKNLRKFREKRGLSRSDAAKAFGMHYQTYYACEKGRNQMRADKLHIGMKIYDKKLEDFFK
jgi:DNA-binding XRE family transcriptional regulator